MLAPVVVLGAHIIHYAQLRFMAIFRDGMPRKSTSCIDLGGLPRAPFYSGWLLSSRFKSRLTLFWVKLKSRSLVSDCGKKDTPLPSTAHRRSQEDQFLPRTAQHVIPPFSSQSRIPSTSLNHNELNHSSAISTSYMLRLLPKRRVVGNGSAKRGQALTSRSSETEGYPVETRRKASQGESPKEEGLAKITER